MTDPVLDAPAPSSPAVGSTAPLQPAPAKPATVRTPGGMGAVRLTAIILVVILAAAGWLGWELWQEREGLGTRVQQQAGELRSLQARTEALEAQLVEISTRQSDLSRQGDRNGTDIAAVQSRAEESFTLMSRIGQELSGGRARFQLAAVEHLLLLASDRLLLHRDTGAALIAMDLADERLAALSDPALFPVREALSQERAALRAVPRPDITSATLTLSSLIERVPQLPLIARAPTRYTSTDARGSEATGGTALGWRRVLASVQETLASLVTIRRDDNSGALRMLPPETEAIVYHVLTLKLEGARVALLRGDTVALREELHSASAWLDQQFRQQDPGVLAARGELERLQQLDLTPPLPQTGRGLALLRAQLAPRP